MDDEEVGDGWLPPGVVWPPVGELVPCHAVAADRCTRLTTTRAHYCCVPCRVTAESSRTQTPTVHSPACDAHHEATVCAAAPAWSPPPAAEAIAEAARIAFTLRLTPGQADDLDTLVLRLRRQLGRGRLDKADVLLSLVQAANANDEVRAAALVAL